jgi:hypothetical protein
MKIESALVHIVDGRLELILRDEKGNDTTLVDEQAWKGLRSIAIMKAGKKIIGLDYTPKK